jgi:uncharacterized membrane protein YoaK (UPF0700 family)
VPTTSNLWRSLVAHPKFGAIPVLLLGLTVVTGCIDAVSILSLGRVFVANMTGNVVFVGFALAGAPGFSLAASLSALAGFLVGAAVGGALVARRGAAAHRLLRDGVGLEFALVTLALVVAAVTGSHRDAVAVDALAAVAALAMGIQNAVVRALAVPDLTTTVLTMTLTGIAADLRRPGKGQVVVTRVLAVAAMLVGALVGALLVLNVSAVAGFALAAGLLAVVAVAAHLTIGAPGT